MKIMTPLLMTSLATLAVCSAAAADTDKTLVAWVRLDNLEQTGSGVLAIQQEGDEFDAITFGEQSKGRWMAGSHLFRRTQAKDAQDLLAPETASPSQWLQIAVVYRGRQIEIWRNGELYASYEVPNQQSYSSKSDLYLGLRCIFGPNKHGFLQGAIDEARIYNVALDRAAIAKLKPGVLTEPKPLGCWTFDDGIAEDVMGHYPKTQLMGTARIKDGVLLLDGNGFALVSSRIIPEYHPPKVQAGFYTPLQRVGEAWDNWISWHDGIFYMYYLGGRPGLWDAHEIAVSPDGVHWDYHGIAVRPRPGTQWVGTGHVWKSPTFDRDGLWILNYSEWVDKKQDIMFATSPDLLNWTKADENLRFVQDDRWYKEDGRWDCIDVVEGDDGWLYGYFTADPDSAKVDYPHCGFGFARSKDGLRWEARSPVPGNMTGEFGGIQKIGERYYITMSDGQVGVGDSPRGPFTRQEKNYRILGGKTYFPRFFHTAPDAPLMNHFYNAGPIYAAPLKAIHIDDGGILRLVWWPGNEKIKASAIPIRINPSQGPVRWLEETIDINQTTVIEGTVRLSDPTEPGSALDFPEPSWNFVNGVRLPGPDQPRLALRGFVIDQGNNTAECISFERAQTRFGDVQLDAQPLELAMRHSVNRDLDFGLEQKFRILLNRDMVEVYVNDYLTILTRVRNTGRFGFLSAGDPDAMRDLRIWRSANESEAPKGWKTGELQRAAHIEEQKRPPKDDVYSRAAEGAYTVPPELTNFRILSSTPFDVANAEEAGYDIRNWQGDPSRIIYHGGKYHVWMIDGYLCYHEIKERPANGLSWIRYLTSEDGMTWRSVSFVPLGPKGSACDMAIEQANVLMHEGRFYLFSEGLTTNEEKYGSMHAGIICLTADRPEGPWKQVGDAMLSPENDGSSFDSMAVVNPRHVFFQGKWFIYYKGDMGVAGVPTRNGVAIADSLTGPYTKYERNPLLFGHGHFAWRYKHGIIMMMFDWDQKINTRILWSEDGLHFAPLHEGEGTFVYGSLYVPYDPLFGEPVTEQPCTEYWGLQNILPGFNVERMEWKFGPDSATAPGR